MADYLTVNGVAELTGRTPHAIRKLVERRLIPYRKHGRRVIFKKSEILAYFDNLPGMRPDDARKRQDTYII